MLTRPGLLAVLALAGCAEYTPEKAEKTQPGYIACLEPRPELCTQQYDPVCAERDTGIRCVTTPCDSSEWLRYANACMACADSRVYGYVPRDCDATNGAPDR